MEAPEDAPETSTGARPADFGSPQAGSSKNPSENQQKDYQIGSRGQVVSQNLRPSIPQMVSEAIKK